MTDRDTGEVPISMKTIQRLDAGVLELLTQDGLVMDTKLFVVDDLAGVEAVTVGHSERGQFIMVTKEAEIEGPFTRDIFIIEPKQPKHYRVNVELDDQEREAVEQFMASIEAWKKLLVEHDPLFQAEQVERLQSDSASFNEVLHMYQDVIYLRDIGDITKEEAEERLASNSLSYTSYEYEDPEEAAYEAAYVASAQAMMDFLAVTIHVDRKLDNVTNEIIDGDGTEFAGAAMPIGEARAWTLLGILDRVSATKAA